MANNKVIFGSQTLLDLTSDTIVANKLLSGKTAHDASGNQITGTYDFATATAANAIADDVTEGKTGWANGVQIIGTKKGIPTWADGTDAEIAEALTRHYNDEIDLNDYWTVGDERVVHLSALTSPVDNLETQPEQDVTLVLVNRGGRTLTTPINNHTECAFIVGMKDCLKNSGKIVSRASSDTNGYGWHSGLSRWSWCNLEGSMYQNTIQPCFPQTLIGIFKKHINKTIYRYNQKTIYESNDIFSLPFRKEIFGETSTSADPTGDVQTQLEYYANVQNRKKKGPNDVLLDYWTSTKYYATVDSRKNRFFYVINDTTPSYSYANNDSTIGISLQMVI